MYEYSNTFWIKKAAYLSIAFVSALLFIYLWNFTSTSSEEDTVETVAEIDATPTPFSSVTRPFDIIISDAALLSETTTTLAEGDAYSFDIDDGATMTVSVAGFDESLLARDFTWTNQIAEDGSVQLIDTPTTVCLDGTLESCSAGNGVLNILVEPAEGLEGVLVEISDLDINEDGALSKYQPIIESITITNGGN